MNIKDMNKNLYEIMFDKDGEPVVFEKDELNDAIAVLNIINPIRNFRNCIADIVAKQGYCEFFGTAGFYVTCFVDDDNTRHGRVTIMPYSVLRFLKEKKIVRA